MRAWFSRIWNDEEAFTAFCRYLLKSAGSVVSGLVAAGILVPPGSGEHTWALGVVGMSIFGTIPTAPLDPKIRQKESTS